MSLAFGVKVRDKLTGFEGTIDGKCEYMTGCVQWRVVPSIDKDGKMQDSHWIDVDRLIVIPEQKVNVVVEHPSGPVDCLPPASRR